VISDHVRPEEWLTDLHLTPAGEEVRQQYAGFCNYLDSLNVPSFKVARAKYFLQRTGYWALPEGYALPPHTINVCVNNLCNLRCRYCDFGQRHDETFYHKYNVVDRNKSINLPIELCKDIVDQVRWFKPIIRASFREPLLYPNILEFIEYTKKNELPFWLLTNGFNLSKFAKDLVALNVDSIRLSLDGPQAIHDKVRGVPNSYRRMIDGAKLLLQEIQENNSSMALGFYFTVNDWNQHAILETIEALDNEGILKHVFINFQWLLYTTKKLAEEHNRTHGPICGGYVEESTIQNVDMQVLDLRAMSEQAEAIAQRYPAEQGYRIHFRPSFEFEDLTRYRDSEDFPVDAPRCRIPWYNLNINPEGEVKSFHHCLLPVAGNVTTASVMDVWNGETLRSQRDLLRQHGAYRGCARCWGVYSALEDLKRKD